MWFDFFEFLPVLIVCLVILIIIVLASIRRFDKQGYDQKGYNKRNFRKDGIHKNGTRYDHSGLDFYSFHQHTHRYIDGNAYDPSGFDFYGFNKAGFDRDGYGRDGFSIHGFDRKGFGRDGYDKDGYDKSGYNKSGYDHAGFGRDGFDKDGFDKTGYGRDGYNRKGFGRDGYNKEGYNSLGYDRKGFTKAGYDRNGYDRNGYNKDGYDNRGYNKDGYDKTGFNNLGYDKFGYNRSGYNSRGFSKEGYDIEGFDSEGYSRSGRNRKGQSWWRSDNKSLLRSKYFDKFSTVNASEKAVKNASSHREVPSLGNAYNILGLSPASKLKQIEKRASEIQKMMTIDVVQKYDCEVFPEFVKRDEKTVKDAVTKLIDPGRRMLELFFWFDTDDDQIKTILLDKNIELSLFLLYKNYYLNSNIRSLRNALLLSIVYFAIMGSNATFDNTLEDWRFLITNSEFWSSFKTKFNDTNDWAIEEKTFNDFKSNVIDALADVYYRLSKVAGNLQINSVFYKTFHKFSPSFYQNHIVPLLIKIRDGLKGIEDSEIQFSNKQLSASSKKAIETLLRETEKYYKEIDDYGMLEIAECKTAFDGVAQRVRNLTIDILNKTDGVDGREFAFSKNLFYQIKRYASSDVLKKRIEDDLADMDIAEKKKTIMADISRNMKDNHYDYVREQIDKLKKIDSGYQNQEFCRQLMIITFKNEANTQFGEAMESLKSVYESARYGLSLNTRYQVINALEKAKGALDVLITIADKEGNNSEKIDLMSTRSQINSQLLQMGRGW